MMIKILLLSLVALCIIADAHEHGTGKFVSEFLRKDIERHLRRKADISDDELTVVSPGVPRTKSEFSKALLDDVEYYFIALKSGVNRHVVKGSSPTPADDCKKISTSSPTKDYTKPTGSTTTPGYTKPTGSTTTPGYTKPTGSSTTPGCTDTHTTPAKGCSESVHSTTTSPPLSTTHRYPTHVGSIKGVPGINFPDYTDIPLTSFTCSEKYLPGFYADMETGCQVFHVCWPNRRESFLCPLGTTFNQALLACDYWYSTNCSLSPHYYSVNAENSLTNEFLLKNQSLSSMINVLLEKGVDTPALKTDDPKSVPPTPDTVLSLISQFLPVKAKVTVYPETKSSRAKIVASSTIGSDKVKVNVTKSHEKSHEPLKPQPTYTEFSKPHKLISKVEESEDAKKLEDEAYEIAVKIFLDRLSEAVKSVVQELTDIGVESGVKSHPSIHEHPIAEKPKKIPGHSFEEYDLATKRLLERLTDGIKNFLKEVPKHRPVPEVPKHRPVPEVPKHRPVPEVPKPTSFKKHYTLTQLNPRFIIKPVMIPKQQVDKHTKPVPHPKIDPTKVFVSAKRVIKSKHVQKPVHRSKQSFRKGISPLTKKALLENYMRLLKIKSV